MINLLRWVRVGTLLLLAHNACFQYASADPAPGIPEGLIFDNLESRHLFWVELGAYRLHVLERIAPRSYLKIKTLPISLGKKGIGKQVEGDQKTPIGVYQVTSFFRDEELDDFYGNGAYPVNFPNVWDRISKRTGHGIWLHGLPKGVDSRPSKDSDGCIVVDNPSLVAMDTYVDTGESLMVFAESLNWLPAGTPQPSDDVLEAIERWRLSWEANDIDAYLSNYHSAFTDTKRGLSEWTAYKTGVNKTKSFIEVKLSNMSVIDYPGEENLVAVRFYQRYRSSNHDWQGWKHLLWRRDEAATWRILYEGNG